MLGENSDEEVHIKFNDAVLYGLIKSKISDKISNDDVQNMEITITKGNIATITSLDLTGADNNKISDIT